MFSPQFWMELARRTKRLRNPSMALSWTRQMAIAISSWESAWQSKDNSLAQRVRCSARSNCSLKMCARAVSLCHSRLNCTMARKRLLSDRMRSQSRRLTSNCIIVSALLQASWPISRRPPNNLLTRHCLRRLSRKSLTNFI